MPWEYQTPLPEANADSDGATLQARAGSLYVYGPAVRDIYRFERSSEEWSNPFSDPLQADALPGEANIGGRFYVVTVAGDLRIVDPVEETVTAGASVGTALDSGYSVAVLAGLLYLHNEGTLRRYDPGTDAWTDLTGPPVSVWNAGLVGVGGKVHLFGGEDSGSAGRRYHYSYDPGTDAWTAHADMPVTRAGGAVAAVDDRYVYIVGGQLAGGAASDRNYLYDDVTGSYAEKEPLPQAAKDLRAVRSGARLYLISTGAWSIPDNPERFLVAYDPDIAWGDDPHVALEITVEPAAARYSLGSAHSITATAMLGGDPVPDLDLYVSVSGANPIAPVVLVTDASGQIEWDYAGSASGADVITVSTEPPGIYPSETIYPSA